MSVITMVYQTTDINTLMCYYCHFIKELGIEYSESEGYIRTKNALICTSYKTFSRNLYKYNCLVIVFFVVFSIEVHQSGFCRRIRTRLDCFVTVNRIKLLFQCSHAYILITLLCCYIFRAEIVSKCFTFMIGNWQRGFFLTTRTCDLQMGKQEYTECHPSEFIL